MRFAELVMAWELGRERMGVETKAEKSGQSFGVNAAQTWLAISS